MRPISGLFALFALGLAITNPVMAQENSENPSPVQPSESRTTTPTPPPYVFNFSHPTLWPQAGAILFSSNERLATGLLGSINFFQSYYANVGVVAGGLYSGLNGNLSGASEFSAGISSTNRSYIFQVPADLKFSVFPNQLGRWTFAPHIGANLIYSSSGLGAGLGNAPTAIVPGGTTGSTWNLWASIGTEIIFNYSKLLDIGVRYDGTLLSQFPLHTLTLALGFKV